MCEITKYITEIQLNNSHNNPCAHIRYETKLILKIRSLVLTWELADDNPEHIDFWRITITKVAVYVVGFPHPFAAGHTHYTSMSVERT